MCIYEYSEQGSADDQKGTSEAKVSSQQSAPSRISMTLIYYHCYYYYHYYYYYYYYYYYFIGWR